MRERHKRKQECVRCCTGQDWKHEGNETSDRDCGGQLAVEEKGREHGRGGGWQRYELLKPLASPSLCDYPYSGRFREGGARLPLRTSLAACLNELRDVGIRFLDPSG